ncbi:hypothetical protein EZV62_010941 [Acer yangbiense]|uniref:TF-B3 domain-containing protein n=1 Tax=Acer yangbiense TaxID=1000413 RepID=A0A5C7I3U4_9ROSI|nr:hypothetical protein EZV62_010941 [Acer yangbiense]
MNSLQLHGEDVHAAKNEEIHTGFEEREIWLERQQDDLLNGDDSSILYGDFPPLPDFPCMSSSSSSSSTPAPVKAIASSSTSSSASSSSSAASWAVLKSDTDEDMDKKSHGCGDHFGVGGASLAALSSTASMEIPQPCDNCIEGVDCMDVMENLGYMDLLDSNDLFDPSSIFNQADMPLEDFQQEQHMTFQEQPQQQQQELMMLMQSGHKDEEASDDLAMMFLDGASDDLAAVFLDWLKTNKETVSADDLRRVKIKKSTIECASRRLGGGKEAMKQLLKLILEWVQTNHLNKRRSHESNDHLFQQFQNPSCINPIPITPEPTQCFTPSSPWIGQPSYVPDPAIVMPGFPSVRGYMGDPFANGSPNMNSHSYPPQTEFNMVDSAQSWPPSQFALASHYNTFPDNNNIHPTPPFTQYPYPYHVHGHGGDQRPMGSGSSATKEARKKRMARQRRLSTHPRHHHHHHHNNQQNQNADQHARFGSDACNPANAGNWVFWSPVTGCAGSTSSVLPMQPQNYQRQGTSDRRQGGWKPEKNLRFLLQKVLKQSDVGNLGRIVLPKKEAETHLPELEARDGISIAMEDVGTSRVWNMRYRFWPNNKSRMYLLENTGDFVRANGLQEGDFIVIYSDIKCGKYLIRGVKVRQQGPGPKSESKRPGKSHRNQHANSPVRLGNASSSSPITQTVK